MWRIRPGSSAHTTSTAASFVEREEARRDAERMRVIGPLLTQLASATP
jgi:hypothetical protein